MRFGRAEIWTFVGVIGVIVVADEEFVSGSIGENVFLPCPCSDRNLDTLPHWQKEFKQEKGKEKKFEVIISDDGAQPTIMPGYKSRVKLFLSNCSLLLTNLVEGDQGKYWCYFHRDGLQRVEVHLNISGLTGYQTDPPKNDKTILDIPGHRWVAMLIIPMVLVLGLSLALFYQRKVCQGVFLSQQDGEETSPQIEVEKGLLDEL